MLRKRDAVRPAGVAHRRERRQDRSRDLDFTQHRRREEVWPEPKSLRLFRSKVARRPR
jgi:hypothetical protein